MDVKSYMTSHVVTVTEKTKVLEALDIMKENDFHRLPVVRDGRMVGLVTQEIIQENSPSTATSLSIHEMNYLLTKTTVGDIMQKKLLPFMPMICWKKQQLACVIKKLAYCL